MSDITSIAAPESNDHDGIISFVQQQRLSIYAEMKDDVKTRLEILNSLSKTSVDVKKIKTESEDKQLGLNLAKQFHGLIKEIGCGVNPFESEKAVGSIPSAELPDIELNPGEGEIGLSTIDINDIACISAGIKGLHK